MSPWVLSASMSSSTGRPSVPPTPSAGTDPGLEDVLESLYRDSGRRHAALPRFEPALRPPEDAEGYAWLYRPEPRPDVRSAAWPEGETVVRAPALPAAVPVRRRGVALVVASSSLLLCVAVGVPLLAHLF